MRYSILLIILWMVSTEAFSYIAKPSDLTPTIKWEITDDGVLRIYGTGEMPEFGVSDKPKFWRHKKYYPQKIKRIEIGEGITKIGWCAFESTREGVLKNVPISLPSTLKSLSISNVVLEDSRLPAGLEEIYSMSNVITPNGKIIVPKSVKYLRSHCFPKQATEIIIEGCPKLNHNNFFNLTSTDPQTTIIFEDPFIDLTPLSKPPTGGYDLYYWESKYYNKWSCTLVLPRGCKIPQNMDDVKNYYTVVSPEILEAEEAEKNVNGYIANRLGTWEDFIRQKSMPVLVTEDQAVPAIKYHMEKWQKKGEFETTAQWEKRVNEKTRKEKLAELTSEWNDKATYSTKVYNEAGLRYKKEYETKREALRKEFYVNLAKKEIEEYRNEVYSLDTPYDADNETFLIKTNNHGDILLHVPRADAPGFKQEWKTIVKNMDFAFLPESETSVGLSRMIFPYNGKEYSYDGKTHVAYNVADPTYNFTPLEVKGLRIDNSAVASIPTPEPQGKVISQSNSSYLRKEKTDVPDIDKDIPQGALRRDKTFAFIIANENYKRSDPVTFAINDGESMRKYCEKTLGIPSSNITYEKDASLNDMRYMLKRISDISSAFGNEASILIYYAGHGVPDEDSSNAYLVPVDGYVENVKTSLSLKDVVDALSGLSASNITLFLDACFSGTGRDGRALYASRGVAMKPKAVTPKGNLVIFSASQGVESALPYKEKQHGLFTYYLLKKLKDSKGQVSLGELAEYIINNVMRTSVVEGKMQTPTINASSEKANWEDTFL